MKTYLIYYRQKLVCPIWLIKVAAGENFPPPPTINLTTPASDDVSRYSMSSYSSHENYADGDGLNANEWDDSMSVGSDTISEDQDFGARTASMSRAGTVRKSMNR